MGVIPYPIYEDTWGEISLAVNGATRYLLLL